MKKVIFVVAFFISVVYMSVFPKKTHTVYIPPILIENGFDNERKLDVFLDSIAYLESRGNYRVVNRHGMLGKYQFSPITLSFLGYRNITREDFLRNESLQDTVMVSYMRSNYRELRSLIERYNGRIVNGVRITPSSVLAGAHFAGPTGVRNFITGHKNPQKREVIDSFGTKLSYYMNRFSDIEIPVEDLTQ